MKRGKSTRKTDQRAWRDRINLTDAISSVRDCYRAPPSVCVGFGRRACRCCDDVEVWCQRESMRGQTGCPILFDVFGNDGRRPFGAAIAIKTNFWTYSTRDRQKAHAQGMNYDQDQLRQGGIAATMLKPRSSLGSRSSVYILAGFQAGPRAAPSAGPRSRLSGRRARRRTRLPGWRAVATGFPRRRRVPWRDPGNVIRVRI